MTGTTDRWKNEVEVGLIDGYGRNEEGSQRYHDIPIYKNYYKV